MFGSGCEYAGILAGVGGFINRNLDNGDSLTAIGIGIGLYTFGRVTNYIITDAARTIQIRELEAKLTDRLPKQENNS